MDSATPSDMTLPTTLLGSTGREVTRLGLGGEGVLRSFGEEAGAAAVIAAALDAGIGYFDTAPAYAGSEKYLGQGWAEHPGARETIFHTSKSASRDREGALRDLDRTLSILGTDYLDLWQIHDVRTAADVAAIDGPGGALEAFLEAREAGRVRHIGVTGHHDPAVLTQCVLEWPVDTVLLPVNPVEGALADKGFLATTLPAARQRGLGVVAMKIFGGGHYLNPRAKLTPELLLRYALSQDVDVCIVGCAMPDHVRTLVRTAAGFQAIPTEALGELEASFAPYARKLAFYRGVI